MRTSTTLKRSLRQGICSTCVAVQGCMHRSEILMHQSFDVTSAPLLNEIKEVLRCSAHAGALA